MATVSLAARGVGPGKMSEACFHHEAFFYAGEAEFLSGTVPFVREGVEAGEAVLVALPPQRLASLRAAMNGEAEHVAFVDMEVMGRNPARIISVWRGFVDRQAPGLGVRGVGEPVWAGRSEEEMEECSRHELLVNRAFEADRALKLICPYETERLPEEALLAAERNHPTVSGVRERSTAYAGAVPVDAYFAGSLSPAPSSTAELSFTVEGLAELRRLVAAHAEIAGLGGQRTADIVAAANEIATNSLLHGGGVGELAVWHRDDAVVCDFRDRGPRVEDPLVGRARPAPDDLGGRGIWLANQLCDLVQIRWEGDGTLVRLTMGR